MPERKVNWDSVYERCRTTGIRLDEVLEKQPSEIVPFLVDRDINEVEKDLTEAGFAVVDDLTYPYEGGEVRVYEMDSGGAGVSEIPYIYLAIEKRAGGQDQVVLVNTTGTPNESPEMLEGFVLKMVRQAMST